MPANETYSPARAAKQVGIPGSTLRHWAKGYAEFLSPESNPEPGSERRFTDADVEVLKAIAQLRANDLQPDEIKARLRDNPATALQTPVEGPASHDRPAPLVSAHDSIQAFLQRTEVLDAVKDVDRRLERLENRNNTIMIAAVAFTGGAVVVAMIVWLLGMVR